MRLVPPIYTQYLVSAAPESESPHTHNSSSYPQILAHVLTYPINRSICVV